MLLAQATTTTTNDNGSAAAVGVATLIWLLAIFVIQGLPLYFIYKKAGPNGDPAWSAFIPLWQWWTFLKVIGRPSWWFWLLLGLFVLGIPTFGLAWIAMFVLFIILLNDLSKSFGKDSAFTVGLVFLNWIFLAILAWGSAQYRGPAAATGTVVAPPPPPAPA